MGVRCSKVVNRGEITRSFRVSESLLRTSNGGKKYVCKGNG